MSARAPASGARATARHEVVDAEFDAWVRVVSPGLVHFSLSLGLSPHDAADSAREALIAVYLRWERLLRSGDPAAYARRVVVNRRISWWRAIGRRERLDQTVDARSPLGSGADHAAATDDAAVARRVLRGLPPRQRAAVVLRYYDDLGFARIADILGCSESTARSYVHRALGHLHQQLGGGDDQAD